MKVLYHAKPYKVYGVCTDKCDSSSCGDTYTAFICILLDGHGLMFVIVRHIRRKNIRRKGVNNIRYALRDVSLFALSDDTTDEEKIIFTIQGSKADMNYNLTFPVVVLKDENDSVPYMAYIPYFDVMTQGYDEEELQMMIKDLLNLCLEDKESYTIPAWAYSYFNEDDVKERGRKYFEELDDGDDTYFQKNFYTVWWFDFRR